MVKELFDVNIYVYLDFSISQNCKLVFSLFTTILTLLNVICRSRNIMKKYIYSWNERLTINNGNDKQTR